MTWTRRCAIEGRVNSGIGGNERLGERQMQGLSLSMGGRFKQQSWGRLTFLQRGGESRRDRGKGKEIQPVELYNGVGNWSGLPARRTDQGKIRELFNERKIIVGGNRVSSMRTLYSNKGTESKHESATPTITQQQDQIP